MIVIRIYGKVGRRSSQAEGVPEIQSKPGTRARRASSSARRECASEHHDTKVGAVAGGGASVGSTEAFPESIPATRRIPRSKAVRVSSMCMVHPSAAPVRP